jgi:hypothetical protein
MITDDPMQRLPWTRDRLTLEEFEQWVASRKEAGRAIDIEICELARWPALDADPYGIVTVKGELPEEMCQIGTNRWVRSPESRGWIWEGDLPTEKGKAMYDRIHREWEAYKTLVNRFENAANTFKLHDESDFATRTSSSWDVAWILREAIMDFADGRGVLDVGTIFHFVDYAIEAGIRSGRARRELAPPHGAAK